MHAIAHAIEEHWPEKTVMYSFAEKFMYQFVRAICSDSR
ncbi:MAG: DnaA/Hda family protein [Alphaproteobacteria bacterium]